MNEQLVEEKFTDILRDGLGLDLTNPSLKDTPHRYARMLINELCIGLDSSKEPRVTVFPNDYNYNDMIILRDITVYSLCEHHFLPFSMKVHIGYIPNKKIIGISKLARIAKYFAARPQVQERLCKDVADFIEKSLEPKGVAIVIEGQHLCMQMRGVQNTSSIMITSEMRGAFDREQSTREEFLNLVHKNGK